MAANQERPTTNSSGAKRSTTGTSRATSPCSTSPAGNSTVRYECPKLTACGRSASGSGGTDRPSIKPEGDLEFSYRTDQIAILDRTGFSWTGGKTETEGAAPVSTRPGPRLFPLHPYTALQVIRLSSRNG